MCHLVQFSQKQLKLSIVQACLGICSHSLWNHSSHLSYASIGSSSNSLQWQFYYIGILPYFCVFIQQEEHSTKHTAFLRSTYKYVLLTQQRVTCDRKFPIILLTYHYKFMIILLLKSVTMYFVGSGIVMLHVLIKMKCGASILSCQA